MRKQQLIELREMILNDKISLEKAGLIIFSTSVKTWTTKDWKNTRLKLLKQNCEQCGSTEHLALVHTGQPRNYSNIKREKFSKYESLIKEKFSLDSLVNDEEIISYYETQIEKSEKALCPKCGSFNLSVRKTLTPKYRCNYCNNVFKSPIKMIIPVFVDDRESETHFKLNVLTYSELKKRLYEMKCKKKLLDDFKTEIEKETLLELIDEYIEYISGENAITLCKKCAFLWNVKNMNLCPVCKIRYKSMYYKTCWECKYHQT